MENWFCLWHDQLKKLVVLKPVEGYKQPDVLLNLFCSAWICFVKKKEKKKQKNKKKKTTTTKNKNKNKKKQKTF